MSKLFFSYAHVDSVQVKEICDNLIRLNYTVWYDRELSGGEQWWDTTLTEIENCDVFLLALTEAARDSIFCQVEYRYALALNKPFLPMLLKPTSPLPEDLEKIQYVDLSTLSGDRLAFEFIAAKNKLDKRIMSGEFPTPDPLPSRPEIPRVLPEFRERVRRLCKEEVSQKEQDGLIHDLLKLALRNDDIRERRTAVSLLQDLQQSQHISPNSWLDIKAVVAIASTWGHPSGIYELIQNIRRGDDSDAQKARQDLKKFVGNEQVTPSVEALACSLLVYDLVQIYRAGSDESRSIAQQEIKAILEDYIQKGSSAE